MQVYSEDVSSTRASHFEWELNSARSMCLYCGFIPVEGMQSYCLIHGIEARCVRCDGALPSVEKLGDWYFNRSSSSSVAEQGPLKPTVAGSIPASSTKPFSITYEDLGYKRDIDGELFLPTSQFREIKMKRFEVGLFIEVEAETAAEAFSQVRTNYCILNDPNRDVTAVASHLPTAKDVQFVIGDDNITELKEDEVVIS